MEAALTGGEGQKAVVRWEAVEHCRVYWGSHGCKLERGHDGPHLCGCADDSGINPETREYEDDPGVFNVGAPPYYGPETRFYGEDAEALGLPMPVRLHIKGGNSEPLGYFEVKPGESIGEVAKRLGVTIREEQVEPEPRKLSAEAVEFIASYQREDPTSVLAVYWRYRSLEAEEFDTVEQAERFIEGSEDDGSLAGEAIVDAQDAIRVLG